MKGRKKHKPQPGNSKLADLLAARVQQTVTLPPVGARVMLVGSDGKAFKNALYHSSANGHLEFYVVTTAEVPVMREALLMEGLKSHYDFTQTPRLEEFPQHTKRGQFEKREGLWNEAQKVRVTINGVPYSGYRATRAGDEKRVMLLSRDTIQCDVGLVLTPRREDVLGYDGKRVSVSEFGVESVYKDTNPGRFGEIEHKVRGRKGAGGRR